MMNLSNVLPPRFVWGVAILVLVAPGFSLPARAADDIVDHPDKLKFEDLDYSPPLPAEYRHTLSSGVTAYVAENHEVPTFDLTMLVRTGSIYDPVDKA
jgi:hypothetical protein